MPKRRGKKPRRPKYGLTEDMYNSIIKELDTCSSKSTFIGFPLYGVMVDLESNVITRIPSYLK